MQDQESKQKISWAHPEILSLPSVTLSSGNQIPDSSTQRFVLLAFELDFPFCFLITPTGPGTPIPSVIQGALKCATFYVPGTELGEYIRHPPCERGTD